MTLAADSNIAGLELMIRVDDQPSDYDFLAWTYPAFDEVACAFSDSTL